MSHTITISLKKVEQYLNTCDNLISKIEKLKSNLNEELIEKFDIENSLMDLQKSRQYIESLLLREDKNVYPHEYSKIMYDLSHIEKECANLEYAINEKNKKNLEETFDKYDAEISALIKKYGTIFYDAINHLKLKNEDLTCKNVEETISTLRQKELEEENKRKYISDFYEKIDNSSLIDAIKLSIKQQIRNIKTSQEFADVLPLIESKIQEQNQLKFLKNEFDQKLSEVGFKLDKNIKQIIELDEYSNIVIKYVMVNSSNNRISIIMNSEGQIKYKLGNYKGHMCNKTTELLINKLKESGWTINITSIKRDIDNNKPLEMERNLNELF